MAQTTVDWLLNMYKSLPQVEFEKHYVQLFEQAKEMEKEQHDKWYKFLETEKMIGVSDLKTIERVQWYYNTYFNETFKK
jgi:hypothetical protein